MFHKRCQWLAILAAVLLAHTGALAAAAPQPAAQIIASGLRHPWDIAQLPDGALLFTQRGGTLSIWKDGQMTPVGDIPGVAARGEGGLTGLALNNDFSNNRLIYLAYNTQADGEAQVKVTRWRLSPQLTLEDAQDIVTGIPANPSGRHSGCQLEMGPDNILWIGTGDAADANNPQNPASLGGKVLRVTRDGQPAPGNLGAPFDPRIYSYGHRNIQGLVIFAQAQNQIPGYSAEHGTGRDDELNPLLAGNFGWAPHAPYDEGVPMTDTQRFPDAIAAAWQSGDPTIAVSGLAQLAGPQWGSLEGALVMGVLKDQHLHLVQLQHGQVVNEQKLLAGQFGRIRACAMGRDGFLYLTTSNGEDDKIIRVQPGQ